MQWLNGAIASSDKDQRPNRGSRDGRRGRPAGSAALPSLPVAPWWTMEPSSCGSERACRPRSRTPAQRSDLQSFYNTSHCGRECELCYRFDSTSVIVKEWISILLKQTQLSSWSCLKHNLFLSHNCKSWTGCFVCVVFRYPSSTTACWSSQSWKNWCWVTTKSHKCVQKTSPALWRWVYTGTGLY